MPGQAQLLPGTLDLLILKAVSLGPLHGYGVLLRIGQISGRALLIEQGALYPALFRLVRQGLLKASWGTSENNRRAKFYELTQLAASACERKPTGGTAWPRRWLPPWPRNRRGYETPGLLSFPCRSFFHRSEIEDDMEEELRSHIQLRADDLERSGLDRAEAERRARIEFGGRERFREEGHEALGGNFIETFFRMCASAFACCASLPDSQSPPF